MDISLPEVQALHQNARFFKDDTGRDLVEISFVGVKDTVVKRVTPDVMATFKQEWDAYCDGRPLERRAGIPLAEIVSEQRVEHYIARNIHNVEELAMLSDAQCQAIGHGTLTERAAAQKLLSVRRVEADERARKAVSDASASLGPRPAEKYAAASDLAATNAKLDVLADNIGALVAALADKPKRGRPPKDKAEE